MSKLPPARVAKLSGYLGDLISDVAAQGKIAKIQGDPVQVAAVALLSGGIAIVEAFVSDVSLLAGNAKAVGKMMVKPALASAVSHGVGRLIDKLFP